MVADFKEKLKYKQLMELYDRFGERTVIKRYSRFKEDDKYEQYLIRKLDDSTFTFHTTYDFFINDTFTVAIDRSTKVIKPMDNITAFGLHNFMIELAHIKLATPRQVDEIVRLQDLQRQQDRMNQYELLIPLNELTFDQASCIIFMLKVRTDELDYKINEKLFDKYYTTCEDFAIMMG